jgi:hypothetical protein
MPRARLTLRVPEHVWIGEVSRSNPETRFRVLAALADDESGVSLVELSGPDVEEALADLRAVDEVREVTPVRLREQEALVQLETSSPFLLFPIQGSGTPLEFPFTLLGGTAEWEVTAPQERLSALGEQLREFGIDFDVRYVREQWESESLLTERQLELIREAVRRGYYDTPRTCSLTELADHLGMAKSTLSESLHRAEERIVKQFLADATRDGAPDRPDA